MITKPFGKEFLCDLYDCDPVAVDDLNVCYQFLDNAVEVLGVHKQAPPFIFRSPGNFPDKAGLSGWVPLIESSITIHTLSVSNFISINFYTCGNLDDNMIEALLKLARETFKPGKVEAPPVIDRGVTYYAR